MGSRLLLDPSLPEESCSDGEVMIAGTAASKEVAQVIISGEWSVSDSKEVLFSRHSLPVMVLNFCLMDASWNAQWQAVELCLDGCSKLDELVREALREQTEIEGSK